MTTTEPAKTDLLAEIHRAVTVIEDQNTVMKGQLTDVPAR